MTHKQMKYKVECLQGDIYQVFIPSGYEPEDRSTVWFQGTLPECDAWIRLHEQGYM